MNGPSDGSFWHDLWKHLRWPVIHMLAHGVISLGFLAILGLGETVAHRILPNNPVVPIYGFTVSDWFLFLDVSFASLILGVGAITALVALLIGLRRGHE